MAYFIFTPNKPDTIGVLYRIASDDLYLNNLNINKSLYNIITDNDANFQDVQLGKKNIISYTSNNTINYEQNPSGLVCYKTADELKNYIQSYSNLIDGFIENNPSNPLLSTWVSYKTQLLNTDIKTMVYPMTINLEQYYKNNNLPVLSPLQLA
jgi:hypothetical protein